MPLMSSRARDGATLHSHCIVYYEIWGHFHCLFREGFGTLSGVMSYEDQRCLGLYLLELNTHRDTLLKRAGERQSQRHITDFFTLEIGQQQEQPGVETSLQCSTHIHTTTTSILIDRAVELGRSRRPRLRGATQHRRRLQRRIRAILSRRPEGRWG